MFVSIDAAGRLVIPKAIRREAGLSPDVPLLIEVRDGEVVIRPRPRTVELVDRGGVKVAVPIEPSEPLTGDTVRGTQETLRAER